MKTDKNSTGKNSIKKRQKVALIIITVIFFLSLILNVSLNLIIALLTLFTLIIFHAYVPRLSRYGVPQALKHSLYSLPLYIPLIIIPLNINSFKIDFDVIKLGVIVGVLLVIINIKAFTIYLSKTNHIYAIPIKKQDFLYKLKNLIISIIGEEIYFRMYLIEILKPYSNIVAILISSLLFAYIHYLIVWSDKKFNYKSYIQHFMVGIGCSILYLYTDNIVACIIAHFIFDTPHILSIYIRTKIKNKEEITFEDYK